MSFPDDEIATWIISVPETRDSYPRKGGRASPKTGNTKDIIPKTNIKDLTPFNPPKGKVKFDPLSIPVPEWLNAASWNEWVTTWIQIIYDWLDALKDPNGVKTFINTTLGEPYEEAVAALIS
ncbi:hypothetical protein ELZ97_10015 [Salmonella enterica subsp. enterica serovar Stanleyville]|nr:hypothetical protein ELZ97_10015 [Salmonella enterica subsp. enterica serovar Stanleyville]AZT68089.1 hypothetical protein ELZ68_09995 [Salmonella enterica subsp. enterica serovar Stanleyville]EAM3050793.1 hypothetical protein [Salmonella enterica]EAP0104803.1 hypothetical protein [Salmonella enterica]